MPISHGACEQQETQAHHDYPYKQSIVARSAHIRDELMYGDTEQHEVKRQPVIRNIPEDVKTASDSPKDKWPQIEAEILLDVVPSESF